MFPLPDKLVVGITGGIACGKSTVCKKFEELDLTDPDICARADKAMILPIYTRVEILHYHSIRNCTE